MYLPNNQVDEVKILNGLVNSFNLSVDEAIVYSCFLKYRYLSVAQIVKITQLTRNKVNYILKKLIKTELVLYMRSSSLYYIIPPKRTFSEMIDINRAKITKMKQTVETMEELYQKGEYNISIWETIKIDEEGLFLEKFVTNINKSKSLNIICSNKNLGFFYRVFDRLLDKKYDTSINLKFYIDSFSDTPDFLFKEYMSQYNFAVLPRVPADSIYFIFDDMTLFHVLIEDDKFQYCLINTDKYMPKLISDLMGI